MSSKYDLIVIGSGSGGLGIAMGMLELGFKVLLVDKSSEKIGGECLNTGCVPSKVLLHIAKEIYQARQAPNYGLKVTGEVNIEKVWNSVTKRQEKIREHENAEYLRRKGMEVILGVASFHNKNSVKINGKIFKARKIVIATGSSPRKLNIKGLENIPSFTNENIFEIDFIPKNFVFIGAGPVSIEMAQAFARLGSKVTVVHRGKHFLKREDLYISEVLLKKLEEESIKFSQVVKFIYRHVIIDKLFQNIFMRHGKIMLNFFFINNSVGKRTCVFPHKHARCLLVRITILVHHGFCSFFSSFRPVIYVSFHILAVGIQNKKTE